MKENKIILIVGFTCLCIFLILSYENALDKVNCRCEQLLSAISIIPDESPVYTDWTSIDSIIVYGNNLSSCAHAKINGKVVSYDIDRPADIEDEFDIEVVYIPRETEFINSTNFQDEIPGVGAREKSLYILDLHEKNLVKKDEISLFMWGRNQEYRFAQKSLCRVKHLATAFFE